MEQLRYAVGDKFKVLHTTGWAWGADHLQAGDVVEITETQFQDPALSHRKGYRVKLNDGQLSGRPFPRRFFERHTKQLNR